MSQTQNFGVFIDVCRSIDRIIESSGKITNSDLINTLNSDSDSSDILFSNMCHSPELSRCVTDSVAVYVSAI